jgi:MinD-like ATPase involved in chromosome partitioning or flagellar assembly
MIASLDDNRLIFVTGKGGVGKSTVTAALARGLARRGERTLVVETDVFSAMDGLLDIELGDHEMVDVEPDLQAINLKASECVVEAMARLIPSERIVRTLLGNRIAQTFFEAAPGVNQFAMLEKVRDLHAEVDEQGEPKWDHIVVDLPASGHAVTFLSVASTFRNMIKVGPVAEAAGKVADIVDDRGVSSIVAVCLPEEMPVNETVELDGKLRDALGRGLDVVLANMVHRPPLDEQAARDFDLLVDSLEGAGSMVDALLGKGADDSRALRIRRIIAGIQLADDWHRRDVHHLKRLREALEVDVYDIPVFYESDGLSVARRMIDFLDRETRPEPQSLAS